MNYEGLWVGSEAEPDHYRLLRHLGGGSQGQVWEAEELVAGDTWARVAVKIGDPVDSAEDKAQWTRYGGLLRSLHSVPGLVRVVDVFWGAVPHHRAHIAETVDPSDHVSALPDGPTASSAGRRLRYVVMALEQGETLADVLHRQADQFVLRRLMLLRPVATALDAMHDGTIPARPVMHGDVKPDNVLIRPCGGAVLVDLGSARITDDDRPVGRTRHYAAPELYGPDHATTPATDRFAFAATVAHVLLGKPPPVGDSGPDVAVVRQALTGTDEVPPSVADAVHDALVAPPDARPAPLLPWLDMLIAGIKPEDRTGSADAHFNATSTGGRDGNDGADSVRMSSVGPRAWLAPAPVALVASALVAALVATLVASALTSRRPSDAGLPPTAMETTSEREATIVTVTSDSQPAPTSEAVPPPLSPPAEPSDTSTTVVRTTPSVPPAIPAAPSSLSATMACDSACETTERVLALAGAIFGNVPNGDRLVMFSHLDGGDYFRGSYVTPSGESWAGSVYIGNSSGGASFYDYDVCLYLIDNEFYAHMEEMGAQRLNDGLDSIPTRGKAESISCVRATWRRPA